MLLTLLTEQ
ncbi:Protein of unknown function [Bacillus mobilis]|nr:Protein of unknown function [Bacillus mobilis]SCL99010.1 Protein of unknown function [Bacillus wiedmannii]